LRTTHLILVSLLLSGLTGCAASGSIFAGDGQGRTLGAQPDDDDDAVSNDDDAVSNDDDAADDDDSVPAGDLATGIDITAISLNQSVQVMLMEGEAAPNNLPLVQGRPGLLRLHLTPQDGWDARPIVGTLSWDPATDDLAALELTDTITPSGPSTDGDINSTLNFQVPSEYVSNGAGWRVELREVDGGSGGGDADRAQWPREGDYEQFLAYDPGTVRIRIVPIAYNADGSGRLPDTSDGQLQILSDWIYRIYPTDNVELTVGDPWELNAAIQPNGSGWGDLLYEMTDLRQERDIPSDTYIYGMFRPTDNAGQFCGGGCVAGLSWRADNPNDPWARASIGLGFSGEGAAGTMIHEIGHAHGRSHANCQVSNPDPNYPHPDGQLGVWGWDPITNQLMDPVANRDMMGYCSPRWVSDYTWDALLERVDWVNGSADWVATQPELPWRVIGVGIDGTRSVRGSIPIAGTPSGDLVHVDWLDASGSVVATVQGRFRGFADADGGTLLVPDAPANVLALRVDGEILTLP